MICWLLEGSCRPQGIPAPDIPVPVAPEAPSSPAPPASSSPAAENIMTDVEAPTEVTNAGEQVIFDETPASGSSQDPESEAAGVTTDMPARSAEEMQMDDVATTITPEMVVEEIAEAIETKMPTSLGSVDDAPSAPSSDNDDTEVGTTQAPSMSSWINKIIDKTHNQSSNHSHSLNEWRINQFEY